MTAILTADQIFGSIFFHSLSSKILYKEIIYLQDSFYKVVSFAEFKNPKIIKKAYQIDLLIDYNSFTEFKNPKNYRNHVQPEFDRIRQSRIFRIVRIELVGYQLQA